MGYKLIAIDPIICLLKFVNASLLLRIERIKNSILITIQNFVNL